MKEHHFDIEDAKKHGVEKAILLYNLRYWLEKNKANNKNVYMHTDDKKYYWTFNSANAFNELFPYLNSKSISRWMKQLEKQGVIISGNHNQHKRDRTKWYSMNEFCLSEDSRSIDHNDTCKDHNDTCKDHNDPPLPDSKPDNKPDKEYISETVKEYIEEIYEEYSLNINKRSKLTSGAKKKIAARLKECSIEELEKAIMNFSRDNWWMSHNAHRGVAWFFHSEDRIDQFINLVPEERR